MKINCFEMFHMYTINNDRSVTHEIVTQPHFGSSIRHFAKKEAMETDSGRK